MAQHRRRPSSIRRLSDLIRLQTPLVLAPREAIRLRAHLLEMVRLGQLQLASDTSIDWPTIAEACRIDGDKLEATVTAMEPQLSQLLHDVGLPRPSSGSAANAQSGSRRPPVQGRRTPSGPDRPSYPPTYGRHEFAAAFDGAIEKNGETLLGLQKALLAGGIRIKTATLRLWRRGQCSPSTAASLRALAALEVRWDLPPGHFQTRLPNSARSPDHAPIPGLPDYDRRAVVWHLPDDFDDLPPRKQEEILAWIQRNVLGGTTDYCRYLSAAALHPYGIDFSAVPGANAPPRRPGRAGRAKRTTPAPPGLAAEMASLVAFKTARLAPVGFGRTGVWGAKSTIQKIKHFSLLFGAMAAPAGGPVRGLGVPPSALCFGLLLFPQMWDWYLKWREERRGFLTIWEVAMIFVVVSLTKARTGWIAQTPALGDALKPVEGLITEEDIARVRLDWGAACAALNKFALARGSDLERIIRVHRDPFEPILSVLESESPVGEYRKIADEILDLRPCSKRYPKPAAESARAFLMVRFALHLGWRARNLRELLVCRPDELPRSDLQLAQLGRGELRWSDRHGGWEVYAPAAAFKNALSTFFCGRPFRLVLPDIGGLYTEIDTYLQTHRARLLGEAKDPGTFFIKTARTKSIDGAYDEKAFYEAWRWIIIRYGIHNPYTGRGAIEGLLPHGPHRVRDVLATHVLKQTGSYEQASFAIQDTPQTIARHYVRFQPHDKTALAARIVNQVWQS